MIGQEMLWCEYYSKTSIFGWPTLNFFQRRFCIQNVLVLNGECAPKKKHFCHIFSRNFPRCSQFGQNRELMGTWESSENQSDRAIKKDKILENSTVKQTLDPPLLPRSPNHFCKKCNKVNLVSQNQSPSSFRCSRYKLSNKKVNNYLSRINRLSVVISQ